MIKFCLTGSIATGKTTVSNFMKEEGIIIIDTDLVTHSLYKYPSETSLKIIETFGQDYLLGENIDRKKLAQRVFKNSEDLGILNSIVHPAVRQEVFRLTEYYEEFGDKENRSFIITYVIPLFFETKTVYPVDYVVIAACSEENQFKRLVEREGYSEDEALRRIKAQISIEEKKNMADFTIDTNKTKNLVKQDVKILLNNFKWEPFNYEKEF